MNSKTVDLNPQRWAQVEALFDQAADMAAADRDAFLADACASDTQLRGYVESLLDSDIGSDDAIAEMIVGALQLVSPEETVDDHDVSGDRVGPYRIVREIGSGGMGIVYLAERDDEQFEQQVAIKLVRQRLLDPQVQARLKSERQILANLDHPNIARLLDGGTTSDGTPYLAMEYIDGLRIDEYCDRNHLGINDRLELFRTICSAVHYAHQNLVVHRDIKASNILVTEDGTPKLLDFGIAKLIDTSGMETDGLTREGVAVMTPESAAPEQLLGRPITTATDTYALGALLYSLLTGYQPLPTVNLQQREVARMICEQSPERPSRRIAIERLRTRQQNEETKPPVEIARCRNTTIERLERRLRGDLDNILLTALRKEPERRYRSANEFADDIRFHRQSLPVIARADTWGYRTSKFVRRHYAGVVTSVVLFTLLASFGLVTSVQNKKIAEERDTAQQQRDKAQEISGFLEEIFMEPDPERSRGLDITAKEILANGAKRIRQQLTGQPEIQSALMQTIGRVYFNLGEYATSVEMLEESLVRRREFFGDDHSEVAVSKNELATSLIMLGDLKRAQNLLEEALKENRDELGRTSAPVAANLYNLSDLHLEAGNLDQAQQYANESIDVYAELGDEFALDLAEAKSGLAGILQFKGDLEQTESLIREAIDVVQYRVGPDHSHMAYYLQNLAVLLQSKGELDEAEEVFHQAIEATRRILGNEHDLLGTSQVRLGLLYQEKGDYKAAETAYRAALENHKKSLGPTHSFVGYDMTYLATLLHDTGDFAAAEKTVREALSILENSVGVNHQYVGVALTALGAILNSTESADDAEPVLKRAIEIRLQDYSEEHPTFAGTHAVYGDTLTRLGRYEEAEAILLDCFEVLRSSNNRRSRRTLQSLIRLYKAWDRPEEVRNYQQFEAQFNTTQAASDKNKR